MKSFALFRARVARARRILRVVFRYRLDELFLIAGVSARSLPLSLRALIAIFPIRLLPNPEGSPARRLRLALEELGPVFVKFGQILSTRPDLLTPEFAEELKRLQDRVTPFPGAQARTLIEAALGAPIEDAFATFETEPMASASVAQVHAATLRDGSDVVVKVIRPGIDTVIAEDLRLLQGIAELLERVSSDARRLHPVEVVADYESTITNELDLLHEAANASQLRRNFTHSPLLYVPRVHWEHTRENVLVLERIYGTPISDVGALQAAGTNMKVLADRGVETFFTQVFEDNFFHADMHPGNIFVDLSNPDDPSYIAVDCAIIGTLTEADQDYLARNLLAFFNQDYRQVARLHVQSGWVPPGTDVGEFEKVIRAVCEPIFQKPISEISFGHFLLELFQTARRFDMEVQPQLVLLQKTLLNIEGVGRQLYPELDLWETAKPFMESWMAQRAGPVAALREVADRAPEFLEQLPQLPGLVLEATRQLQRLDDIAEAQRKTMATLDAMLTERTRSERRRRLTGMGALILGAGLFLPAAASADGGGAGLTGGLLALLGVMLISGRGI
ncbi:MAG: ubiquinone biosynthesis regulatory protein kinase UbiB [Pseudomonadota bacterium]|nr:ubiquinone biosynthesis regulatory protein kinase UbiB [Pseudomonadota bacterium]